MFRRMSLTAVVAAILVGNSVLFAKAEKKTPAGRTRKAVGVSARYRSLSAERLEESFRKARSELKRMLSSKSEALRLYQNRHELYDAIGLAAERVKRQARWEFDVVKETAPRYFDRTSAAIRQYLELTAEDGPAHQAAEWLIDVSREKAKLFREKAEQMQLQEYRDRYSRIADTLQDQAEHIQQVWHSVVAQREVVDRAALVLEESRQFYGDLKSTLGADYALRELKQVCGKLRGLADAMTKVQNGLEQRAHGPAGRGAAKPAKKAPGRNPRKSKGKTGSLANPATAEPACDKSKGQNASEDPPAPKCQAVHKQDAEKKEASHEKTDAPGKAEPNECKPAEDASKCQSGEETNIEKTGS